MQEVTVYIKDGCNFCAKLVRELKGKGVNFREVNLSRDPDALREVKRKYMANRVPVLVEGDKVTIGYQGMG